MGKGITGFCCLMVKLSSIYYLKKNKEMDAAVVFITGHSYLIRMMCSELFVDLGEKGTRKYLPPPTQLAVTISVQLQSPCST